MRAPRQSFATVQTQGGLLPADFLERVAEARDVDGMTPDDYHLAKGETLRESISRSWNRLVGAWAGFRRVVDQLSEDATATTETRERWLLILFQELGYGRLQTTKALQAGSESYPISHLWGAVPIHLLGWEIDLDTRTRGAAGAARWAPHSMVQEYLNRTEEHLWAFVSNGRVLRLLRDNLAMTRQAYVEFDLESMMEGEVYSDFVLLWLLCHQSRVEGERPQACWLERWVEQAQREGTRALERLRQGVDRAIARLGTGFLSHPANQTLREVFRTGELDPQDYYRELLRLVYRLLFLFVTEDREVLLLPDTKPEPRERFERYYSTARLRRLAGSHAGSKHGDLWQGLRLVQDKLWRDGCPELALPALGSFLWSPEAIEHLDGCELQNAYFLEAVRALAYVPEAKVRRPIDFRNLGAEELGSVYESLLELHPNVDVASQQFTLETAPGHERKVTGSYYTPTSLITELLNSALDPLLDETQKADDPEQALLSLKVCDPACGSGHFLIAAANRIAKRLATVRTGEGEPSPDETRRALRNVIGRCIYGIDVNEMAVELCKVSLWLEALEPGKPLSFLDHRIACGNSLLGATPRLLAEGIPDDAFKPLTGDDKTVVSELKKRNKSERGGQATLDLGVSVGDLTEPLAVEIRAIDAIADEEIEGVREKEERWHKLIEGAEAAYAKLVADAWCAAFVMPKRRGAPAVTQDALNRLTSGPDRVGAEVREAIDDAAVRYRFLHWHLAFPDVFTLDGDTIPHPETGWRGGFDLVCGNPPWERVKLSEKEFFATRAPEIANARNRAERQRMIKALKEDDPPLWQAFQDALRDAEADSHFIRTSGRYPLCGRGDVNTYSVFFESMRHGIGDRGFASAVLPLGIATDFTTADFFRDLVERRSLVALFGFENEEHLFPDVDHRVTFCLFTVSGLNRPVDAADLCFFLRQTTWLADTWRHFVLAAEDFRLLNPNTATCPVFRSGRDGEITKKIYRRAGVLIDESKSSDGNPWGISFMAMLHMANDSDLFRVRGDLEAEGYELHGNIFVRGDRRLLPLYEAKMVHHYDYRFGTYEGQTESQAAMNKLPEFTDAQHADPDLVPLPRYWVPAPEVDARLRDRWDRDWLLGWRDICRSTDERTVIAAAIPKAAVGHKFPLAITSGPPHVLLALLSSFVLDYAARQKVGGTSLTFFIVKQLPVLPPDTFEAPCPWEPARTTADWIRDRVLELTYTSHDMAPFARDLGYEGPPFKWDPDRRAALRAELDAAFFHLYGLDRDEVDYIMDTFPIVRRKDESTHGTYRTKDLILKVYDSMEARIGPDQTAELLPESGEVNRWGKDGRRV